MWKKRFVRGPKFVENDHSNFAASSVFLSKERFAICKREDARESFYFLFLIKLFNLESTSFVLLCVIFFTQKLKNSLFYKSMKIRCKTSDHKIFINQYYKSEVKRFYNIVEMENYIIT